MKTTARILLGLVLLAFAIRALACSVCGCGDPMEGSGNSLPVPGQWRFGIETQRLSVEARSEEDAGRRETLAQNITRLSLGYSLLPNLSLSAKLPWNEKAWASFSGAEDPEGGLTSGLGDLDLGSRYFFFSSMDMPARSSRYAALTLGSTLNTGANDLQSDGARQDEHNQPGTGAVGPYAGLFAGLQQGDWTFSAHAEGQFHAPNFSAYQYGSALKFGANLRRDTSELTALSCGLEGRYADYDRADGLQLESTGGSLLNLVPGLHLRLGQATGLSIQAQLPVAARLFGDQSVDPSFSAALQFILN